jgi:hypothetical protein
MRDAVYTVTSLMCLVLHLCTFLRQWSQVRISDLRLYLEHKLGTNDAPNHRKKMRKADLIALASEAFETGTTCR